ncbi:MAG: hypothetical protein AB7O66_22435 [Limisphaerales bacterium]
MNAELIEELLATGEPAGLGPEVRAGVRSVREIQSALQKAGSATRLAANRTACLQGLLLLWHDHLDEAHAVVQDLPGPDAAWVHGIMHRREPDYSNARYWFHRVGRHEAFEPMAEQAAPLLAAHAALPYRLIRDGSWDPMAFIDAVSAAIRPGSDPGVARLIVDLQRAETLVLARHLLGC